MNFLTSFGLNKSRLTVLVMIGLLIQGLLVYLSIPKRENPAITIRNAIVSVQFPGMAPERMEDLIVVPIERKVREIGEVEDINTLFAGIRAGKDPRYDIGQDGIIDFEDADIWITSLKKTWKGDADLNGEFDSGDLVAVFRAGHYEDSLNGNSGWAQGDWNGDLEFDSSDLVAAFRAGGYDQGYRVFESDGGPIVPAVPIPEPHSVAGAFLAILFLLQSVRRQKR